MYRMGFDMKEHGETEFHYTCERCGHVRTRTLSRATGNRRATSALHDVPSPLLSLFGRPRDALMVPVPSDVATA
jgi:hypothetical protein